MEENDPRIEVLHELGLNKYGARIYIALVSEGVSTAKNLSDITSIPYGKVYETINDLASKGFCVLIPTKPMKCKAVSPSKIMELARKYSEKKIDELQKQMTSHFNPLFDHNKESEEPTESFLVVKGRKNIIKLIDSLIEDAETSIHICGTQQGLSRLSIHKEHFERAKKKSVDIKIAGPVTSSNRADVKSLKCCCKVVNVPDISSQLVVIDGHKSLLVEALPDDQDITYGRDVGIVISNHAFSTLLDESIRMMFSQKKNSVTK